MSVATDAIRGGVLTGIEKGQRKQATEAQLEEAWVDWGYAVDDQDIALDRDAVTRLQVNCLAAALEHTLYHLIGQKLRINELEDRLARLESK
jgi:hypothetical protein